MRVVTAVVSKDWRRRAYPLTSYRGRREPLSRDEDLPWDRQYTTRREHWLSPEKQSWVEVVTNEPETTGTLIDRRADGTVAAWTGYLDESALNAGPIESSRVAELTGIFALVSASADGVQAFTNIHRMEQLYWAEGKDAYVISTSPRVAHRAAQLTSSEPPLEAVLSLANAGFMLSDHTPFPGVFAVPANSELTVGAAGLIMRDLPMPDVDPDEPVRAHAQRLTVALVRACEAATTRDAEVRAHLTGGKDSRVVAAVLQSIGADVRYSTNGWPGDPDVEVGVEVARRLGLSHTVRPPAGVSDDDDEIVVDPLQRAYDVIKLAGGQITAWEGIGRSQQYRLGTTVLGGHGGELLRAGFAFGTQGLTPARAQKRVLSIGAPLAPYMTPRALDAHRRTLHRWTEAVSVDPTDGLSQMYRELRTGRWLAVAWGAYALTGPRRSILADNAVVRAAAGCNQERASTEELVHQVVHDLVPDLCEVRFAHNRWRFEKDGPTHLCERGDWGSREPFSQSKTSTFNWRSAYGDDMHAYMRKTIMNSPVRGYFTRSGLAEFFEAARSQERFTASKNLWAMFTAAALVGPKPLRKHRPDSFVIGFPR